jgi:hypothetical protein
VRKIQYRYKYCNYELVYKLLNENIEHDIIDYLENNTFNIRYSISDNIKYYSCISIVLVSINKIKLVTTFPESKNKKK